MSVGLKSRRLSGYADTLTEEDKERIINEFLPFVKYTAYRLSWRLPAHLTVEDLICVGLMGLMDSLEKFEEGRVKLKTYAEKRIRGAMLDELRAVDWLPRSAKKKADDLRGAYARCERRLGRMPEEEEVAAEMGISLDEYFGILRDSSAAVPLRFEDLGGRDASGEGMNMLDCIADPGASTPLEEFEKADMKERLAAMIDKLPEKEKMVLSLYYWEELTMKEIGKVLGITESRVCQLHGQSLLRLHSDMEERAPDN